MAERLATVRISVLCRGRVRGSSVLSNTKGCPATRAGYQILAALNGKAGEPNVPQEDDGN